MKNKKVKYPEFELLGPKCSKTTNCNGVLVINSLLSNPKKFFNKCSKCNVEYESLKE